MVTRQVFAEGQRVVFRESEDGLPEPGVVRTVFDPCPVYPNGGVYDVDLADGDLVHAYWTELTPA